MDTFGFGVVGRRGPLRVSNSTDDPVTVARWTATIAVGKPLLFLWVLVIEHRFVRPGIVWPNCYVALGSTSPLRQTVVRER